MKKLRAPLLFILFIAPCLSWTNASAEVKVIEAEAVSAMSGTITTDAARRISVLESRWKAHEQVISFVSGLPQVRELRLPDDEIGSYTAGVPECESLREEARTAAGASPFRAVIRCRIDTDVILKQIDQFRDTGELKEQLIASWKADNALRKERASLLARLERATDGRVIEGMRAKLDAVLAKEEASAEVRHIWSQYAQSLDFCDASKHSGGPGSAEIDKTMTALDRVLKTDRKDFRARFLLTSMYELKGDPNAAEKQLRTAITANPTNPLFRMKLGLFLKQQNRYEEALREFLAFERLRPKERLVLFHIGMTYKNLDQCRQSVVNLKRFLLATEKKTSPRVQAMRTDASATIKECEGKPHGPAGRQRPIRKIK